MLIQEIYKQIGVIIYRYVLNGCQMLWLAFKEVVKFCILVKKN